MPRDPENFDPIENALNPFPTIKSKNAVVRLCQEKWGVPVRLHNVRRATNDRTLASHLIGGCCVYSERDVYCWLRSMRRAAADR